MNRRTTLIALLAPLALAAAPARAASVLELKSLFQETVDDPGKARALAQLARTAPVTRQDIEALYDLWMRFPIDAVRQPVLTSLQRVAPRSPEAEGLLLRCLADDDDASLMFGIKGVERVHPPAALAPLRKLAERKFKFSSSAKAQTTADRNAWWVQYEALSALAEWEGAPALPLLKKRAKEAPEVAKIMALHLWKESLPVFLQWAKGNVEDKARASEGLDAPAPASALRATRAQMLEIVRDPLADAEIRHNLALKVGLCSSPEEVTALLKEHEATPEPYLKRLLAAAAFASRDRQIIPLLTSFAKTDPQANVRAGARLQLKDLLSPADYRALLQWAVKSDPDPENRDSAALELK